MDTSPSDSPGVWAQIACILEVTARKAGNVHREKDFADTHFLDFLLSAAALGPVLEQAPGRPVGQSILECIRATRRLVESNTNLGIVLLLAPLAAAPVTVPLAQGIGAVLKALSIEDARMTYEAMRLARPGGMGEVAEQDLAKEPTQSLREVMSIAAPRDLIARQYVTDFAAVLEDGAPVLRQAWQEMDWEAAIQKTHLHFLAQYPDSLIVRKRGLAVAQEAGRRARQVLATGFPHAQRGRDAFVLLDAWLREGGNARNPGTSADLVTACLYVGQREGWISGSLLRGVRREPEIRHPPEGV